MLDLITGILLEPFFRLLEPRFTNNMRFSSLDEVFHILDGVHKSQQKLPYVKVNHKGYVARLTVIDTVYRGIDRSKIKVREAKPKETLDFIRENFSEENCAVMENRLRGYPSKKSLILRYDITERIPTEEYEFGGRIYKKTGKKMIITKREKELGRINPNNRNAFRDLPFF